MLHETMYNAIRLSDDFLATAYISDLINKVIIKEGNFHIEYKNRKAAEEEWVLF
jgi:hypothetical protein